jgi:hypothetical protein
MSCHQNPGSADYFIALGDTWLDQSKKERKKVGKKENLPTNQ